MNNIKFQDFERITKPQARKIYENGGGVYIIPAKCYPSGVWVSAYMMQNTNGARPFDSVVNEYTYYNCNNYLGKYPAFYKRTVENYETIYN